MDGFIGEYYHTIDTKGRVIIPQKYREDLGDTFILSKGLDGCLWIHPMDEWREFTAKLRELSTIDKESRQFKRFFMSGATECEFDKQGRILVPASLRKYADLQKDVVLTGMDTRIELWSAEKWDVENDMDDEDMEAVAAHMESLGGNIKEDNMTFQHYSVLLNETIEQLDIKENGIYVDGTLGGGGHASAVLQRLGETGRLIGIDQDAAAIEAAGPLSAAIIVQCLRFLQIWAFMVWMESYSILAYPLISWTLLREDLLTEKIPFLICAWISVRRRQPETL